MRRVKAYILIKLFFESYVNQIGREKNGQIEDRRSSNILHFLTKNIVRICPF